MMQATTEETGSDRFEIQRSLDSKKLKTADTGKSIGESKNRKDYFFTNPVPQAGENLFRMKMIDLDGSFSLSGIRSIRHDYIAEPITYLKPATDRLWVRILKIFNSIFL